MSFQGVIAGADEEKFIISTSAGYGFISEIRNTLSNKKTGKNFIKLTPQSKLVPPIKILPHHQLIVAISSIGRMLIFSLDSLPILPRGKGNKIINIPKAKFESGEEAMTHICLLGAESKLQLHSGKQFKNFSVKDLENYLSDRAKRGLMLPQGYRKVDRVIEVFDVSEDS